HSADDAKALVKSVNTSVEEAQNITEKSIKQIKNVLGNINTQNSVNDVNENVEKNVHLAMDVAKKAEEALVANDKESLVKAEIEAEKVVQDLTAITEKAVDTAKNLITKSNQTDDSSKLDIAIEALNSSNKANKALGIAKEALSSIQSSLLNQSTNFSDTQDETLSDTHDYKLSEFGNTNDTFKTDNLSDHSDNSDYSDNRDHRDHSNNRDHSDNSDHSDYSNNSDHSNNRDHSDNSDTNNLSTDKLRNVNTHNSILNNSNQRDKEIDYMKYNNNINNNNNNQQNTEYKNMEMFGNSHKPDDYNIEFYDRPYEDNNNENNNYDDNNSKINPPSRTNVFKNAIEAKRNINKMSKENPCSNIKSLNYCKTLNDRFNNDTCDYEDALNLCCAISDYCMQFFESNSNEYKECINDEFYSPVYKCFKKKRSSNATYYASGGVILIAALAVGYYMMGYESRKQEVEDDNSYNETYKNLITRDEECQPEFYSDITNSPVHKSNVY
ncbi:membrane associated erythrocyte binding-like protein, partial [Hepatocystis sp. ex Piliocolobus tephrosceles]